MVCGTVGTYPLGPMAVASGDAFGLYSRAVVVESGDAVIVYPRLLSLEELGLPARSLLGDTRAQLRLFEDPSRTMGVREYVPGDGLRRVHWKTTARQGRLQVRVHEQTTTHKVGLFLSADDFTGLTDDDFELAISVMASVARSLVYRGGQVGLWVNAKGADNGRPAPAAAGRAVGAGFGGTCQSHTFFQWRLRFVLRRAAPQTSPLAPLPCLSWVGPGAPCAPFWPICAIRACSPWLRRWEGQPGGRVPGVVWHTVRRPAVGDPR